MPWVDDSTHGTGRTGYYHNLPEECGRVVRLVCSYAHDVDDVRELCATLGLDPRDGYRTTNTASDLR